MIWNIGFKYLSIALGCLIATGGALAAACYEESPAHGKEGDAYFDLPKSAKLTGTQKRTLERLVDQIRDEWRGTGGTFLCKGKEGDSRPEERQYQAKIIVSSQAGDRLRLEEQRYFTKDRISNSVTTTLFDKSSSFKVIELTANRLVLSEKNRRGGSGAALWETIHTIGLQGDGLTYDATRYVNGYLASIDRRSYRRGRFAAKGAGG